MKPLNKKATKIFKAIIGKLNGKDHLKLDDGKGFMPLVVERLGTYDIGTQYSFCHYFEQNGDLCQDPEMVFILHQDGLVYPCSFQQAIPPIFQESFFMEAGSWKFRPKIQSDHASFANVWMENITYQQPIAFEKAA